MVSIATAFVVLAAVFLWALIGARGPWKIKLPLIVIVPCLGFVIWAALGSYKGWPTTSGVPNRAVYVGALVREPDQNQSGAIYLWLIPIDEDKTLLGYDPDKYEPRAYRLPYSRTVHKAAEKAKALSRKGLVLMRRGDGVRIPKKAFRAYRLPQTLPSKTRN